MKRLKIIFGILLFISQMSFGQVPVPVIDVKANSNLTFIGKSISKLSGQIGKLLKTEGETKVTSAKNLKESVSQGEKMQQSLDALTKVTAAIKSVKAVKNGIMLIYNTVKDTYYIIYQMNNMKFNNGTKIFQSNDIEIINNDIDFILDEMNSIFVIIQKLVKDDVLKMDDGKRLELILSLNKDLKSCSNKVKYKVNRMKELFQDYLVEPIND